MYISYTKNSKEVISQTILVIFPNTIVSCSVFTREHLDSIYPINITDSDDTFILRIAYDENTIT